MAGFLLRSVALQFGSSKLLVSNFVLDVSVLTLVPLTAADNTTNAMSMITHPITPTATITIFDSAERKCAEGIGREVNLRLRCSNSGV